MGSWDCYCAICGGPFCSITISRKPRTARYRKKWAKVAEKREDTNVSDDQDVTSASEAEQEDDKESLDASEEDYSYDPEVISEDDVAWTKTLHVLGFNPKANGSSK